MNTFHRFAIVVALLWSQCVLAQTPAGYQYWPPAEREGQQAFETALKAAPMPASLRAFHDLLGSEPHIAGTPGDARNIQRLAVAFRMLGLEVQIHEFWAYLAKPIEAQLQIMDGTAEMITLPLKEAVLPEDRFSKNRDLPIGFNAYSGSGDVTAEVVYANYGTKADFEKLKELGIKVAGNIVIARYGGNFRGMKAKFAEQAGAVGLIIFTDPADSGFGKGPVYPEGGWANESYIQRGSIDTLDYPGDPLTPGEPAGQSAFRLDQQTIGLPRIPVQPIGYGAAKEIIARMQGVPLPENDSELIKAWRGGLPCEYRLTGGPELRVRLMVKQEREVTKTANVIGTMLGSVQPQQKVIIGCHHDAWGFGAGDPLSGTILVMEAAKSFSEAARAGYAPNRTLVFALWGAEEFGIIGSTEYCEQYRDDLMRTAVAYINLDAATMGTNFGSSASPSLKRLIDEVVQTIPQAHASDKRSVHQAWLGDREEPHFGNLGGGSDHIGFYCHLGIPSCSVGADGAPGTAYHSNYDNLAWYRKVIGDDYQPALMLTRVVNVMAARLANAAILPLDPVRYGIDGKLHLEALEKRALELKLAIDLSGLKKQAEDYRQMAHRAADRLVAAIEAGEANPEKRREINEILLGLERAWLVPGTGPWAAPSGLAGRPWFRNLFAASDPDSGYAAWMLPELRQAIERNDSLTLKEAQRVYGTAFQILTDRMKAIEAVLAKNPE